METSRGPTKRGSRWWYVILLIPFLAMFWVASYNRVEPSWGGVPFFYWYQLAWIVISAAVTLLVYLATRD